MASAELLESRRLLAVDVVAGTLVVTGSARGEHMRMWYDEASRGPVFVVIIDVPLSQMPTQEYYVPAEGVRSIRVRAGAGDDIVDLFSAPTRPWSSPVSIPSRIDGGFGDDRVIGGRSRDLIVGGFGDDRIDGQQGDDWIDGGWGDDVLSGNFGNDYVSGSFGNDSVHGDEGDDRLSGGPGNDRVGLNGMGPMASEPGNDVLFGGSGEDWMVGGSGRDVMFGGSGRDHWSVEDAESEMLDRTPDEPKDVPQGV